MTDPMKPYRRVVELPPFDDPMITAANTLESSPKPSYGPHKASERYLDDEDRDELIGLVDDLIVPWSNGDVKESVTVDQLLEALETLRTHLRKKYYGG